MLEGTRPPGYFVPRQALSASAAGKESMKDEYGNMDAAGETFVAPTFQLENG